MAAYQRAPYAGIRPTGRFPPRSTRSAEAGKEGAQAPSGFPSGAPTPVRSVIRP